MAVGVPEAFLRRLTWTGWGEPDLHVQDHSDDLLVLRTTLIVAELDAAIDRPALWAAPVTLAGAVLTEIWGMLPKDIEQREVRAANGVEHNRPCAGLAVVQIFGRDGQRNTELMEIIEIHQRITFRLGEVSSCWIASLERIEVAAVRGRNTAAEAFEHDPSVELDFWMDLKQGRFAIGL